MNIEKCCEHRQVAGEPSIEAVEDLSDVKATGCGTFSLQPLLDAKVAVYFIPDMVLARIQSHYL